MTLSHKTLLAISCISFSLYTMEREIVCEATTAQQRKTNQKNYYTLNNLYKKSCSTLANYDPNDLQTMSSIFDIIDKTKKLTAEGMEEKSIGLFAYRQQPQIQVYPFLFLPDTFQPLYTSVFFERIRQHSAHIEKNHFVEPTLDQFIQHIKDKKTLNAIEKAAAFKVFIDVSTTNPNNTTVVTIPNTVMDGIKELEQLMEDIAEIKKMTPEEIKIISNILYNTTPQKL